MSKMDIYYGALIDYRKNTRENSDCVRQRKYIARANADDDKIEVVTNECEIEDDWIVAIEKGLDFIEKAIKEERQFILSNGEVVPIEKVKNVSKESAEHLAKHSNLLTRVPKEGEDLIPDKLYTVERLTDFSVYENRFLYMLLCYLRDFISLRYNSIVELVTTYSGKMILNKTVTAAHRKSVISVTLDEKLKNDEYLRTHNASKKKIDRIDGLLKAVVSFLSYPLMEEVSKAPMLKPPITETNVLKMNKNFKGAMQLYYFVTAYSKLGYTCRTNVRTLNPLKDHVADEVAEIVELASFLTYEHGLGIEGDLKENYDERQRKLKEEEQKKKVEQLKALKKRIHEHGDDPMEYMLLLEQRNRYLESENTQLARARLEIKALNEKVAALLEELTECKLTLQLREEQIQRMIIEHAKEIADLKAAHEAEIAALNAAHEAEVAELKESYEIEIFNLKEAHAAEIEELNEAHENEIIRLNEAHEARIEQLVARHEEEVAAIKNAYETQIATLTEGYEKQLADTVSGYETRIATMQQEHALAMDKAVANYSAQIARLSSDLIQNKESLTALNAQMEELTRLKAITEAKFNSLKRQSGLYEGTEDYNSKEGFTALEQQFEYFKKLFKEQWKVTKRKIRSQYLSAEVGKQVGKDGEWKAPLQTSEDKPVAQLPTQTTETAQAPAQEPAQEPTAVEEAAQTDTISKTDNH